MFCSRLYHGGNVVIDPEITTISIYRKDKKKLRAIAIANDLRDLKNHPSMREAGAVSAIVICPGCGADVIAGKDREDHPTWYCSACGFTDAPLVREMQLWQDAYDRGFQR